MAVLSHLRQRGGGWAVFGCIAVLILIYSWKWTIDGNTALQMQESHRSNSEFLLKRNRELIIEELLQKHNAVRPMLPKRPFTIDLQDAWIRSDHRPVLIVGTVDDILRKEGKPQLIIDSEKVHIALSVDESLVSGTQPEGADLHRVGRRKPSKYAGSVLEDILGRKDIYAVVAEITALRTVNNADYDFIAEGRCVEIRKIEDGKPGLDEVLAKQ